MAQKLRLDMILRSEHAKELHALMSDRRLTIDYITAWLRDHGYSISRNSVWNYRRFLARTWRPDGTRTQDSMASVRNKLRLGLSDLTFDQLGAVAMLVSQLAESN